MLLWLLLLYLLSDNTVAGVLAVLLTNIPMLLLLSPLLCGGPLSLLLLLLVVMLLLLLLVVLVLVVVIEPLLLAVHAPHAGPFTPLLWLLLLLLPSPHLTAALLLRESSCSSVPAAAHLWQCGALSRHKGHITSHHITLSITLHSTPLHIIGAQVVGSRYTVLS